MRVIRQPECIVPIAADLGFLAGGAVGAVELAARDARETGRQQGSLKPVGDLMGSARTGWPDLRVGQPEAPSISAIFQGWRRRSARASRVASTKNPEAQQCRPGSGMMRTFA